MYSQETIANLLRKNSEDICWPEIYGINDKILNLIFSNLSEAQNAFNNMRRIYSENQNKKLGLPMLVEFTRTSDQVKFVSYTLGFFKESTPFSSPLEINGNLAKFRQGKNELAVCGFFGGQINNSSSKTPAKPEISRAPVGAVKGGSCFIA
jgi:hypothetical protein